MGPKTFKLFGNLGNFDYGQNSPLGHHQSSDLAIVAVAPKQKTFIFIAPYSRINHQAPPRSGSYWRRCIHMNAKSRMADGEPADRRCANAYEHAG